MNLNGKLEGEEEQPLQYVNRFAINIPTGAFNLNIVNPGLTNQSYILNPLSPVGQNIVTHQQPMALQSYIALPTETEGNIIHSLPVGVPVPVGFPVSTGILQNHNFMNTSIIIGNDECNSSGVIKPSANALNAGNEIISYIDKPVEELSSNANTIEVQSIGLNCPTPIHMESMSKKPCPLEMSIKAANIDIEFEKTDLGVPILLGNCQPEIEKHSVLVGSLPLDNGLKERDMKVPLGMPVVQPADEGKKSKTEITWEATKGEPVKSDFRESLICEVEESNEDEEEEDSEEEESDGDDSLPNGRTSKSNQDDDDDDEEDEESSSEESDSLPLSVALRLKSQDSGRSRKGDEDRGGRRGSRKWAEEEESEGHWSDSDDDVLNLKRIKNEFNYKCFYEPNTTKSTTSLVLKLEDKSKKFVRVRSCCSKKECAKKISVQDQKAAHKNFYDLESNSKRDAYLINCIEHVQKSKAAEKENGKDKTTATTTGAAAGTGQTTLTNDSLLENANIQLEIENESNGNQKLSDEIQKAINESLRELIGSESGEVGGKVEEEKNPGDVPPSGEKEKNNWNFYIVIDRCRRKVCLQFLLKLFRINKSRIKSLQKKILSGATSAEELSRTNQKSSEVWELAKAHLDGLLGEECLDCNANPRHRFLSESKTREDLFINFKQYYHNRLGKEPNIKFTSYKRFLDKESSIAFTLRKDGICAECEDLKKNPKRKQKASDKGKKSKTSKEKRTWVVKTESEDDSSEDEPLKRKKLKLTIPLKVANNKNPGKRNSKNNSTEKRHKGGKSRTSVTRGRDVWSLMLLHLETLPYSESPACVSKKRHRFLNSSFTTQGLFEEYRKYFLKETNSELGLGFTMYEKYFNRNCNYMIRDLSPDAVTCPGCVADEKKS